MSRDLYEQVVSRLTIQRYQISQYVDELLKNDEKIKDFVKDIIVDTVIDILCSKRNVHLSIYDDDADVGERLYDYLDNEQLKEFIEKNGVVNPYYSIDMDDPRNRKIVKDNIAEAKELIKNIQHL